MGPRGVDSRVGHDGYGRHDGLQKSGCSRHVLQRCRRKGGPLTVVVPLAAPLNVTVAPLPVVVDVILPDIGLGIYSR